MNPLIHEIQDIGDGMEDLMEGSLIPAVEQGYLIFPAQKDELHQE